MVVGAEFVGVGPGGKVVRVPDLDMVAVPGRRPYTLVTGRMEIGFFPGYPFWTLDLPGIGFDARGMGTRAGIAGWFTSRASSLPSFLVKLRDLRSNFIIKAWNP